MAGIDTSLVESFLATGKAYWGQNQVAGLITSRFPKDSRFQIPDEELEKLGSELLAAKSQSYEHAKTLISQGQQLAAMMEQAGTDSTPMLEFLYCLDGGGGAEAAAKRWPILKVTLQRIVLREDPGKGAFPELARLIAYLESISDTKPAQTLLEAIRRYPEPVKIVGDGSGVRRLLGQGAMPKAFPKCKEWFDASGRKLRFVRDMLPK